MQDPDVITYQLNFYKPLIDKANRLTEEYVSKHKLILTGGMAIDLALREKGDNIYEDDAIPDYDIISDQNLHHAHELAKIMCKEGIPDVNVINAVHITTVRVRVKNIVFLDATYIPTSCFVKIPYMDVGHLRVVHPHYQFIDQRLSLSMLLADTGISLNIFNRLIKDIKRNTLLRSYYPIESRIQKIDSHIIKIPIAMISVDESNLQTVQTNHFVYTGPVCLSGYAAIALLLNEYTINNDIIEIAMPKSVLVRFLTCQYETHALKNVELYRPLLNLKPTTAVSGNFEYVDTFGMRIGCNLVKVGNKQACIASVDYLLMELLRDRIYVDEEPFTSTYLKLCSIVDKKRDEDSDMIWYPSINCYGFDNLPEYKVAGLEKLMESENVDKLKPKNSYLRKPECKTKSEDFAAEDSHYFRIDGAQDNTLKHTNYKYILEEFDTYADKQRA